MYTKEQRIKALKLYIKYGLKAAPVIHELGYPDRKSLPIWYKQYLKTSSYYNHKLRRSKYSEEDRKKAIEFYLTHGRNIAFTIRELGYPCKQILRRWVSEDVKDHISSPLKGKHFVKYSQEKKKEAAMDVALGYDTVSKIAKDKNVSRASLYKWNKEYVSNDLSKRISNDKENYESDIESLKNEIASLQKEVYKLRMEKDILQKANELIKKDEGIDISVLSNREKTIIINALRNTYPLRDLFLLLAISKSSYYYQKTSLKIDKYEALKITIAKIFNHSYQSYGYRRIKHELEHNGIVVSEKVVRKIMKEEGLYVVSVRKKKYSSYQGEITPAVENIIERDFSADKPNEKMLTDITEFNVNNIKIYLSPLVDCFDGYISNWTIGLSPNKELVNTMLKNYISSLNENEKPIIHSDRGGHYRWPEWIELMNDNNLIRSMSKKGCSPDNSACEGFFGRLKNEFFYNRKWNEITAQDFIKQLNDYIVWYNEKRIKQSLGYLSPVDYRKSLGLSYKWSPRLCPHLQMGKLSCRSTKSKR